MEEREMTQRFCDLFGDILLIVKDVEKGFFTLNTRLVKEGHEKFRGLLKSRLPYAEKVVEEKEKTGIQMKYVNLIIPFQTIALGLENLMDRMEVKLDANILFSEKATKEIKELFSLMESQMRDLKDYILTRNPHLLQLVGQDVEEMRSLIDEYTIVHQNRLIAGVCMPKASYLYIDITDSMKRVAKGLAEFSERV